MSERVVLGGAGTTYRSTLAWWVPSDVGLGSSGFLVVHDVKCSRCIPEIPGFRPGWKYGYFIGHLSLIKVRLLDGPADRKSVV